MRKKPVIHPFQGNLFEAIPTQDGVNFQTGQPIIEHVLVDTKYPDGPSVNLQVRAERITLALQELSAVNSSRGLQTVVEMPHVDRARIYEKYGDKTHNVLNGNKNNRVTHARRARQHFAIAFGLQQLVDGGMPIVSARNLTRETYLAFEGKLGSGAYAKERNKYVKNINKSAKHIQKVS